MEAAHWAVFRVSGPRCPSYERRPRLPRTTIPSDPETGPLVNPAYIVKLELFSVDLALLKGEDSVPPLNHAIRRRWQSGRRLAASKPLASSLLSFRGGFQKWRAR